MPWSAAATSGTHSKRSCWVHRMLQAHLLDGHRQYAVPLIVNVFANEVDSPCGDQLRLGEQVALSALTGHRSVITHLERERTPLDHRQIVI